MTTFDRLVDEIERDLGPLSDQKAPVDPRRLQYVIAFLCERIDIMNAELETLRRWGF